MTSIFQPIVLILGGLVAGLAAGVWLGRRRQRREAEDPDRAEETRELRRHLHRAQRMEALGILSGSIMHNLNNLLSVVLGQARMARDDVDPDQPAWHSLGQVIQAGEMAAELTREVDSFQSQSDHDRQPVRLQPVVHATVKLLRDILPDTVQIDTELDPDCGAVLASTTQVQQMLLSLCSNAYHAMYRRHGRITISMATSDITMPQKARPRDLEPGVYVKLSVADNGRGMDGETMQHIFDPYFSARATRRGAGLGLTMVSRLLTANEGVTIPSSLPGHGTRFDLYFPLIARGVRSAGEEERPALTVVGSDDPAATADEAADAAKVVAIDAVPEPTRAPGRPAHVLLVEDDVMVSETVRTCLQRSGLEVTSHVDGASAVAAFAADPGDFDVLLTDQFMRGLDGGEVVAEVRRYRPRIPVVLMSGHPEGIQPEEVSRLEISGTLSKPFTPVQLLEVVKQALQTALPAQEERG